MITKKISFMVFLLFSSLILFATIKTDIDNIENKTIYKPANKLKTHLYIVSYNDKSKNHEIYFHVKLTTITGFFNFNELIIASNEGNTLKIDATKVPHSNTELQGRDSSMYSETAKIPLSNEEIQELEKLLSSSKSFTIRYKKVH